MVQDTRRMKREIGSILAEAITKEQLHECIGIELFITPGLMRHVIQAKENHVRAVLSEQSSQEDQGIQDFDKLRDKSRKSSQGARSRARMLAVGYTSLLKD